MIVTFDLLSALTDTRTGASRAFAAIPGERWWELAGRPSTNTWDRHNKALRREGAPAADLRGRLRAATPDLRVDKDAAAGDLAPLHAKIGE